MKKLKVFLAVGLLCCGLSMSMAEAKTMTLDKTKVLVPQGFSVANDDLKFKKGTVVELNENNEVITGVLNRDIALRPTGWRNVINDYYEESNNSIFIPVCQANNQTVFLQKKRKRIYFSGHFGSFFGIKSALFSGAPRRNRRGLRAGFSDSCPRPACKKTENGI